MTGRMHDEDLEARLRADARTFGGAPSPEASARLRAAIAELPAPQGSPWRAIALIAGAAALFAVYAWSVRAPEPEPLPAPAYHPKVAVDAAIAPLEHELVALADDASAVAGAVWQGVPRPLRALFRE